MTTALLLFAGLLSSAASPNDGSPDASGVVPPPPPLLEPSPGLTEEEVEQMDFLACRAAFALNADLHPSLDGNLLPFFLGGICAPCGGPLWCPLLVLSEQPKRGFVDEALLSWLTWAGVLWAGSVVSAIPWVGWAFGALYCPTALFVSCYLMPVNIVNAWDRAAKVYGMSGEGKASSTDVPGHAPPSYAGVDMPF